MAEACKLLIKNCIICWNYLYLSQKLEEIKYTASREAFLDAVAMARRLPGSTSTCLGFPPLNRTLARRLMEQTRIYRALKGVRAGTGVELAGLERLLVQFSLLVAEQRRIKEIDINPLLVSTTQILALDARIVLRDPGISDEKLPRLAIRRPLPKHSGIFSKVARFGSWSFGRRDLAARRPHRLC